MQLDPRSIDSSRSTSESTSRESSSGLSEALVASQQSQQGGDASAIAEPQQGKRSVSQEDLAAEAMQAPQESSHQDSSSYPPLARAKRLSYCMATALPGKFEAAESIQVSSYKTFG